MGQLIAKLGDRNLLQIKIDPDYRLGNQDIFGRYLGNHPANFSFTTISLPMEHDDNCPDCSINTGSRSETNTSDCTLTEPKSNKSYEIADGDSERILQ